ncbi:MAG: tRNA 5-methoxyuridine(34)/uridine 5-oxyacetic acid(34) synthase CmoB [Calditrichaeota bacterium]|nr:tRNA 5-methoxyuridine(34)/uridine 5-oxyacetic acid(34) synthase CmoB [Calditrichota bacterium]
MIDYSCFFDILRSESAVPESWKILLPKQIEKALDPSNNSDLLEWEQIINSLPPVKPSVINLNADAVEIGRQSDTDTPTRQRTEQLLRKLHPWRKGPFNIFDIFIDTEWRSDLKWNRLKDYIQPLDGRLVLDVGSGNGYHCFRMRGAGARLVMGIDPYLKYAAQFAALQKYVNDPSIQVLPLATEDLPANLQCFDTVFSMGVLYHRRSPFDHLFELRGLLRAGGELILETLIIEGEKGAVLVPEGRYAKMRNVWFIPSCLTLESWLKRTGFKNIRLIDVSLTTIQEQRRTNWMHFESLPDFLHPKNDQLTIEGYPRPRRAIFLAEKP